MRCLQTRIARLRHELNWRGHSAYSRDNWNTPTAQRALEKVIKIRNELRALEALTRD